MSYIIYSKIGVFNYYVKIDKGWAVPGRKFHYEGIKDNATVFEDKWEAQMIMRNMKNNLSLHIEKYPDKRSAGTSSDV